MSLSRSSTTPAGDSSVESGRPYRELSSSHLLGHLIDGRSLETSSADECQAWAPDCEGLFDLLWSDPRHLARHLPSGATERLGATADLARRVSRARVDRTDPLAEPAALVTHLFLQHSRRYNPTSGALYLDQERYFLGEEMTARNNSRRYELGIDTVLRPAFALQAASFVLFQVRVGGDARPTEVELEFAARVHRAALLHKLRLIDSWIVVGPGRWTSLEAGPQAVSPYRVTAAEASARRRRRRRRRKDSSWAEEIALAVLLRRGKHTSSRALNAARRLLHNLGGLTALADADPRQLAAEGLVPRENTVLGAALELIHRLEHHAPPERFSLHRPESLAGVVYDRFANARKDAHGIVLLDEFDGLVGLRELGIERRNESENAERLAGLMREAIETGASKLVPFRFYVSRAAPESTDPRFFLRLKSEGAARDLQVFDYFHVFVSGRFMALGTQGEVKRSGSRPPSRASA